MTLFERVDAYSRHPDARAAACNRIALLVASNQPIYPFYVQWAVGGDAWAASWTLLSTPFFLAVPFVARRNAIAGRMMLPLAGVANMIIGAKAFGTASGVEWFVVPCILISLLAFRPAEWQRSLVLVAFVSATLLMHDHYGKPIGTFSTIEQHSFTSLNRWSVATLSLFVVWQFGNAIRSVARSRSSANNRP